VPDSARGHYRHALLGQLDGAQRLGLEKARGTLQIGAQGTVGVDLGTYTIREWLIVGDVRTLGVPPASSIVRRAMRISIMRLTYTRGMKGGHLVREARLRAGLTQKQLAGATGLSQPTVARIESGAVQPTYSQVHRLVGACDLELRVNLVPTDDADWSVAQANLRLDHDARVRQHQAALRFIRAGRQALASARA
jgi:hypothetical protein